MPPPAPQPSFLAAIKTKWCLVEGYVFFALCANRGPIAKQSHEVCGDVDSSVLVSIQRNHAFTLLATTQAPNLLLTLHLFPPPALSQTLVARLRGVCFRCGRTPLWVDRKHLTLSFVCNLTRIHFPIFSARWFHILWGVNETIFFPHYMFLRDIARRKLNPKHGANSCVVHHWMKKSQKISLWNIPEFLNGKCHFSHGLSGANVYKTESFHTLTFPWICVRFV